MIFLLLRAYPVVRDGHSKTASRSGKTHEAEKGGASVVANDFETAPGLPDADLAKVVTAWPDMSIEARDAILAIVNEETR